MIYVIFILNQNLIAIKSIETINFASHWSKRWHTVACALDRDTARGSFIHFQMPWF